MIENTPASASSAGISFSKLGCRSEKPTIAGLMAMALESPDMLSLAAGFTDNRTLPVDFVDAAWGHLREQSKPVSGKSVRDVDTEFLQYGTNQGRPVLRRILAERIAMLDRAVGPGDIDVSAMEKGTFITNGSQQALYLAMQVLCDPGDIVLVDRPSYFVYLEMLRGLGVQARSLPVGSDGRIDGVALDQLLEELKAGKERGTCGPVKALYFVSYYCNPSGRSLDEAEKTLIAQVLSRRGMHIPVIEDAAYRELYFENEYKSRGVFSLPEWNAFPKLYTATLTKPFSTGMKVGYGICSDATWADKMLHVKGHHDFGSANLNQALLERAITCGDYDHQLARIRHAYHAKMDTLHEALLAEGLADRGWKWKVPEGGLYLWLEAPAHLDTGMESAFCRACVKAGVLYVPGDLCFGDNPQKNFIRLSFGVLCEVDLKKAAARFATAAKQF